MAGIMELDDDCGYLEIIKGPMFSGKTTRLLDIYKKYTFCAINTMVINYEKDNRYSDILLSSHDKVMIPCVKALRLNDIVRFTNNTVDTLLPKENVQEVSLDFTSHYYNEFLAAKAILINEGQFFQDIVPWVTTAVEHYHKKVYICGLNSDFQRQKFGNWLDLETLSDNVIMLHSFCSHCKKKTAIFSHRLSQEAELEVIGADCYIPVCRKCYKTLSFKINDTIINDTIINDTIINDTIINDTIINSSNIHYYPLPKNVN
jgi:thymidine kinase